jgi:hypothetical protein
MSKETEPDNDFVNPIDKDKTAENPGLLPYAHTVGSAIIRPIDKGRTKGLAMSAMYEQTNKQLDQIRKQVELLMEQAKGIHQRVELSERIYQADMNFKPIHGQIYFLYAKKENGDLLSMIAPDEWGSTIPYEYLATVKMLSDSTWEILEQV